MGRLISLYDCARTSNFTASVATDQNTMIRLSEESICHCRQLARSRTTIFWRLWHELAGASDPPCIVDVATVTPDRLCVGRSRLSKVEYALPPVRRIPKSARKQSPSFRCRCDVDRMQCRFLAAGPGLSSELAGGCGIAKLGRAGSVVHGMVD